MGVLNIRLFGNVELEHNAVRLPEFPTRKSKALFAFLVLGCDRLFPRSVLAGEFWGESSDYHAKKSLCTELWRIRSTLKSAGIAPARYISVHSEEIGFNPRARFWVDVSALERGLEKLRHISPGELDEGQVADLRKLITLYRGDLVEGIYDNWCLIQRESARTQFLSAIETLMQHYMVCEEWSQAIACGQKMLAHDPLLEHVHRHLMQCFHLMGNRAMACRQYAILKKILRFELDVEPMEETMTLYRTVRRVSSNISYRHLKRKSDTLRRTDDKEQSPVDKVDRVLAKLLSAQELLEDTRDQLNKRWLQDNFFGGPRNG